MEATISLSLLDVKEAAERCPYAERTLRKYAKEERVEAQKVGNQWVFPKDEIDRLNEETTA